MVSVCCEHLGSLDLTREIGRGGMASVWSAVSKPLGRPFAVKMLAPHLEWAPEARARFAREGDILSRVHHTGIVNLRDRGETEAVAELLTNSGTFARGTAPVRMAPKSRTRKMPAFWLSPSFM